MAIVVGSTEVIDNSRRLQNIAGANGTYDAFHPNVATLSSAATINVNMNNPFINLTLGTNATLVVINPGPGKTSVLALDTSASGFTPSFSSNVKWAEDSEPTWSDHRYWNVAFVCWDTSNVRTAAVGFDA